MIPFNRPALQGKEIDHILTAIEKGQLSGDGYYSKLCQDKLKEITGTAACLTTHSCTAALEMAALLCELQPGDEVIMPSFTFVSTANAVALRGAVPVFIDVRPDTLNIDERLIEAAITSKTRAICPVHYAGVPAEMDTIMDIARRHGLFVIEDAAQALGSLYKGRPAGSLGDFAAFSFHETKNVISGEGGALAINRPEMVDRADILREKGTNRKQFFQGLTDRYTWVDIGSSFLPGELISAFLYGQLEVFDSILEDRRSNWQTYDQALRPYANQVGLAQVPDHVTGNAHLYYVLMPDADARNELIRRMRDDDIVAPFHYIPLHSSPAGQRLGRTSGSLSVTDAVSACLVRLPLYPRMGSDIDRVIERLHHHLPALLSGSKVWEVPS